MQGHEVFALIKDENSKSVLSQDTNRIYGDMNRKSDMEYFIQKSNPTHFIHLAAQTQAYDSLRFPYQTFYNNMIGTLNILECLREYGMCKSIIVASSDKAYGELVGNSYTEDHPLKGIYPYDASKSATDLIANSYRITYELPIVVTRACNIYGVGDYNSQRLIPGIVYSHKKGTVFTLRNNGDDLREYVHVEDVVSAYQKIMHYVAQGGIAGAFNISSGERYTTKQVFDLILVPR
jgi:CDP-glucose 4,6-dehydratase